MNKLKVVNTCHNVMLVNKGKDYVIHTKLEPLTPSLYGISEDGIICLSYEEAEVLMEELIKAMALIKKCYGEGVKHLPNGKTCEINKEGNDLLLRHENISNKGPFHIR